MTYYSFIGFSEPVSSWTHLIASIVFLIVGLKMLYHARGNNLKSLSLLIYVFSGVFLFAMSGVYHLLNKGTTANYVLQILDHAGIYLLIAGSLTPFQIILLRGYKRWIPLVFMWILAITGLTLTAIFFENMPEGLILTFFLGMGWMSLFTVWFIRKTSINTIKLIAIGGLLYTIGAMIDFTKWPTLIEKVIEPHEVFHLFVVAAALVHLYAVLLISRKPISQSLTVNITKFPEYYSGIITSENMNFTGKSEESIKQQLQDWIRESYFEEFAPNEIRIRYYREEHLS